jgi:hypothetical protein
MNANSKYAPKIVGTTISAYYKRLNSDLVSLRARRTGMITNLENNEKPKEDLSEQTQIKYIRCPECGEKIMMVPTLDEMIEAIDSHVSTHKKQPNADLTVPHLKAPTICMELTKQVLQRASDMLDDEVPNTRQKPSLWL